MTSRELAKIALSGLSDKKAQDIKVIDISEISVMADYFIIASGSNRNQVQAMADNVEEKLHDAGVTPRQIEGYHTANWILMDFNDIIVHIFNEEDRLFYNLEKIWLDGKVIDAEKLQFFSDSLFINDYI